MIEDSHGGESISGSYALPCCPLCGGGSEDYVWPPQEGVPRRCLSCGLVVRCSHRFPPKTRLDCTPEHIKASRWAAGMSQFQTRIYPEQDIIAAGVDLKRVLRGAEYEAVTIIRNASHGGCTVFDSTRVGEATGVCRFLHAAPPT